MIILLTMFLEIVYFDAGCSVCPFKKYIISTLLSIGDMHGKVSDYLLMKVILFM